MNAYYFRTKGATLEQKKELVGYSHEFNLDIRSGVSLDGFSEACYNDNSTRELADALRNGVVESDCINWKISENEWYEEIKQALTALIRSALNLN